MKLIAIAWRIQRCGDREGEFSCSIEEWKCFFAEHSGDKSDRWLRRGAKIPEIFEIVGVINTNSEFWG